MGLFSFLANRRATGDSPGIARLQAAHDNALILKGHAYDSAAAALPPAVGNMPVAGNGPKTLHDLRLAAARKQSVASLPASNASAPSPKASRRRSRSANRPNTAPTHAPLLPHHRPKSANPNSPRHGSFRLSALPTSKKTTPGPPYLLGIVGPDASGDSSDTADLSASVPSVPPVPRIAPHRKDAASSPRSPRFKPMPLSISHPPVSPSMPATPVRSGPVRGHIDLLDAQGALKPSDFKTRLQAAGARDYGEDVAERNIGGGGVDLKCPAVAAFYALTGGGPLAYKSDGSAVDVHGNRYAADDIPDNLSTRVQGKDSDELPAPVNDSIQTRRFPARSSSLDPRHAFALDDSAVPGTARGPSSPMADKVAMAKEQRRRSVHGGFSSPATSQQPPPRTRPMSMHPLSQQSSFDEPADVPDIPRASSSIPGKYKSTSLSEDISSSASRRRSGSQQSRKTRPRAHDDFQAAMDFDALSGGEDISTAPYQSRPQPRQDPLHNSQPSRSSAPPISHPRKRSVGMRTQLDDISEALPRTSTTSSGHHRLGSRHAARSSLESGHSISADTNRHRRRSERTGSDTSTGSARPADLYLRSRSSASTYHGGRRTGHSFHAQPEGDPPSPIDGYATSTTDSLDIDYDLDVRRRRQCEDEDLVFKESDYDSGFGLPGLGGFGGGLPGLFDGGMGGFMGAEDDDYDDDDDLAPPMWSTTIQTIPREQNQTGQQSRRSSRSSRSRGRSHNRNRSRSQTAALPPLPTSAPRSIVDMMMPTVPAKTSSISRTASPATYPTFDYDDDDDDDTSSFMSESDPDHILASGSGTGTAGTKSSSAETDSLSIVGAPSAGPSMSKTGPPSGPDDDHTTTAEETDVDLDKGQGHGTGSVDARLAQHMRREAQRRQQTASHGGPIETKRAMDRSVLSELKY
ncbi:hypothetical protein GMORB2_6564 [Geosmithia morbida]|uniref:Uncharacterized protein n=1 Tax=Geosmithia morbida TaxID=1094350 RepID=A0A9P5D3Z9_9HYPO|nr:uncharacterized protein GMORB2_6564 [Geosmithia morbida]KAF4123016.1 hypothetical protein GMORB2_6564 [Geosmithia morbida]